MPTIDISGERFGKLTVIERDTSKHGGAAYWICKCDCGNTKSIRGSSLRQSNQPTRSCGKCITLPQLIDTTSEVGNIYGKLTVLERDLSKPIGHHKTAYWICQCECGEKVSVATSQLRNGKTQSCGCLRRETNQKRCILDLTNKQFGDLVAIKNTNQLSKDGSYLWQCQCQCGNIVEYSVETLNSNSATSCGCNHKSNGEIKIAQILKENNISFQEQYSFSDLCGKNNNKLKYDFAILDDFGNPIRLIEFDGEQHQNPNSKYYTERLVELDNIKNNYAKKHNYPLVRVPYSQLRHLSVDLLLGNKYII